MIHAAEIAAVAAAVQETLLPGSSRVLRELRSCYAHSCLLALPSRARSHKPTVVTSLTSLRPRASFFSCGIDKRDHVL